MKNGKLLKRVFILSNNADRICNSLKSMDNLEIYADNKLSEDNYDLIILYDYHETLPMNYIKNNNIIRVHNSLLPSFNTKTPIKDAYCSGVKVTGVTVHKVENANLTGMILTQYPVIIDIYTHYDQLKSELEELAEKIVPLVVKSILNDTIFDIVDFLYTPHSCNRCSGCESCHK